MRMEGIASFETLPVELLHRIFNSLDARTLLLSIKYVCKRLYSIVDTYNRYQLNFQSISKWNFHRLCQGVRSNDVISLILSDDNRTSGQPALFLSRHPIETYTRLQSITLISIEEPYLKVLLQHLSATCLLTSLTLHADSNVNVSSESMGFVSIILGKSCFRYLDLIVSDASINELEWPMNCSIRNLRCSTSIMFNKFCTILRSSINLQMMSFRDCLIEHEQELNSLLAENISFPQLISLTLEDCDLSMTMIESLFFLIPSLVHLTIKGIGAEFFDGARWERLFQIKLPNLTKFEFAFQNHIGMNCDTADFEAIIAPFQTKFWTEIKHWYVSAVGVKNSSYVNLYSIPDCAPKISFHPRRNKVSRSTVPSNIREIVTMNSVRELTLNLIEMQADMIEKNENPIQRLFNRVTKLILRLNGDWPNCSLELLSSLIDLSTIVELELHIDFNRAEMTQTITGVTSLLERANQIQTLIISSRTMPMPAICSIMSDQIKHLQMPVNHVEEIKMIIDRFDHLFSVTFHFVIDSLVSITEILDWLLAIRRDFTYQSTKSSLSLWLGRRAIQE